MPSTLCPQPQRQGGDLRGTWVDVHPVDVVFDNQTRHIARKSRFVFVGLAKRLERNLGLSGNIQRAGAMLLFPGPCFSIDLSKQIEGI
ncbi:hypothetical protein D3C76_1699740 [compost metagenome]